MKTDKVRIALIGVAGVSLAAAVAMAMRGRAFFEMGREWGHYEVGLAMASARCEAKSREDEAQTGEPGESPQRQPEDQLD